MRIVVAAAPWGPVLKDIAALEEGAALWSVGSQSRI
jgi:hypothetical protein